MDNEKNINVTLKSSDDKSENSISFSFSGFFAAIRRYFLVWIIASVVAAMFVSGVVLLLKTNITSNSVNALVSFNYNGIQSGLDPKGKPFDINKIKSPNIIEAALTELNMPLNYVESVRRNIKLEGLYHENDINQMDLYKTVYQKGGTAAISAIESILDIGFHNSFYIVTLDYSNLRFNMVESKQILDAILKKYQDYFFTTYGYNESLGNSVVAVDYTEYDYPAAIDVFDTTLTNLQDYVSRLATQTPDFRSGRTGYSFRDLSSTIETIQNADLDSIMSYVTINNVTNDKDVLLDNYEYKIESLERQRNVYEAEYRAINNSIETYEKDSMLILGESSANLDKSSYNLPSEKYDELIEQKIEKQVKTSKCNERIDYYKGRIKELKDNKNHSTDENVKKTEERLADINDKVTNLIDIVNATADEYYENVTFARAYNILVPATGQETQSISKDVIMPVILTEIVLFGVFISFAFIKTAVSEVMENKNRIPEEE